MNANDRLSTQMTHLNGVAVLTLQGEIDIYTAPCLRESIERVCALGVPVLLDMEHVTFMDSSGLSALIAASGVADGLFSSVQIMRPSDQVRRVLSLTGLDKVLLTET